MLSLGETIWKTRATPGTLDRASGRAEDLLSSRGETDILVVLLVLIFRVHPRQLRIPSGTW